MFFLSGSVGTNSGYRKNWIKLNKRRIMSRNGTHIEIVGHGFEDEGLREKLSEELRSEIIGQIPDLSFIIIFPAHHGLKYFDGPLVRVVSDATGEDIQKIFGVFRNLRAFKPGTKVYLKHIKSCVDDWTIVQ